MTKEQLGIEDARRIVQGFLAVALAGRTPEDTRKTERVLLSRLGGYRITPQRIVELTGEHTRGLLTLARKGNQAAHHGLLMIAEDLTARSQQLPLPLQKYIITTDVPRFKPRKGRRRGDWIQCAAIAGAVTILTDFYGFTLERNRQPSEYRKAPRPESASSIVASVLGQFRISMGENRVGQIAKTYNQIGIKLFIGVERYKEKIGISP